MQAMAAPCMTLVTSGRLVIALETTAPRLRHAPSTVARRSDSQRSGASHGHSGVPLHQGKRHPKCCTRAVSSDNVPFPDLAALVKEQVATPKTTWLDGLAGGARGTGITAENKGWRDEAKAAEQAVAAQRKEKWSKLEGRKVYLIGSDGELNYSVATRLAQQLKYVWHTPFLNTHTTKAS
eukprot:1180482-Prorocentrum_minimum.AAC.2